MDSNMNNGTESDMDHDIHSDEEMSKSLSNGRSRPSSTGTLNSLTSLDTSTPRKESLGNSNNSLTQPSGSPLPVQYVNADVAEVSKTWRKNFGSLQSMCNVYKNADKLKNALEQAQPHSTDAYNIKLWFEKVQREAKYLSHQKLLEVKHYVDKEWLHFDFTGIDLAFMVKPTPVPAAAVAVGGTKGAITPSQSTSPTKLSHILIQASIMDNKQATSTSSGSNVDMKSVSSTTSSFNNRTAGTSVTSAPPMRHITSSSSAPAKSINAPPTLVAPIRAATNPTSVPVRNPQPVFQPARQPSTPRSTATVSKAAAKKGRKPNKNTIRKQVKESNDQIWFEHLNLLLKFSDEHGHCNVPLDYVTEMDGIHYRLGEWLEIQRAVFYEVSECDVEKFSILEELVLNKGLWCTDVSPDEAAAAVAGVNSASMGSSSSSSSSDAAKLHSASSSYLQSSRMAVEEEHHFPVDAFGDGGQHDDQFMNNTDDTIINLAPMKRKEVDQSGMQDQNRAQKPRIARGRSTKSKGSGLIAEQKQKKIRRTRSKKCTNDSDDDSVSSHDGNGFDSDPEMRFDSDAGNDSSDHEVHITTASPSVRRTAKVRDNKSSSLLEETSRATNVLKKTIGSTKDEPLADNKSAGSISLALDSIPVSESDHRSSGTSTAGSSPTRNPSLDPQANGGLLTRHTKLGRSKQHSAPVIASEEPNYLGFLYGIDGSKDVYFAIGMVKQQTMAAGCLTYSLELMKPKDPANFLHSQFFLEPDEKSQIRHHHIVQQHLRFDKDTNMLDADSRRNLSNRLKTMPHLKIDGAENSIALA